jgi:uncharacterized membrane protein
MKQQPWFILPLLAIWVWRERESLREFGRTAATYVTAGLVPFLLLNAPWLLADPQAWLSSVFVPIAEGEAPLVSTGVGLAALNTAADGVISRGAFESLIPVVLLAVVGAYWLWFDRLRWAAWLAPAVVLFWMPRSLPSYFHWVAPLALLALFARHGRLVGQEVTTA